MIPGAVITEWRTKAPWADDAQVEQDLVLSRALVELYRRPLFAEQALFRGGTALHKLYFDPPGRYSEDIDLVQRERGAIGPLVTEIRSALDHWLGEPARKAGPECFTLSYRFTSTREPVTRMRVKIEINTREHFTLYGVSEHPFNVDSSWFTGQTNLLTYRLPELLGTKLRALYQRHHPPSPYGPGIRSSRSLGACAPASHLSTAGRTVERTRVNPDHRNELRC